MDIDKLNAFNDRIECLIKEIDTGKITVQEFAQAISSDVDYKEFADWVLKDFTKAGNESGVTKDNL